MHMQEVSGPWKVIKQNQYRKKRELRTSLMNVIQVAAAQPLSSNLWPSLL